MQYNFCKGKLQDFKAWAHKFSIHSAISLRRSHRLKVLTLKSSLMEFSGTIGGGLVGASNRLVTSMPLPCLILAHLPSKSHGHNSTSRCLVIALLIGLRLVGACLVVESPNKKAYALWYSGGAERVKQRCMNWGHIVHLSTWPYPISCKKKYIILLLYYYYHYYYIILNEWRITIHKGTWNLPYYNRDQCFIIQSLNCHTFTSILYKLRQSDIYICYL